MQARTLLLLLALPASAPAQETVYVTSASGSRGLVKLTGRIVDYTGRELVLETAAGHQQRYPAEKVAKIETQFTRQQAEADVLLARGEFAPALALYSQARQTDTRTWVRRRVTARMVWCHQALDQWRAAGQEFLLLVRSDPDTLDFNAIPLAWMPSEPSLPLEQAARAWLARDDLPAAGLLGASHLMSTSMRPAALAKLGELATSDDPRIAALAAAQQWRSAVVTVDDRGLDRWQQAVEAMPKALRAGPYYVLGQALAHRGRSEQSALALMRVPILYADHRALSARSLLEAGRQLEKLDRPTQAARLYRELLSAHGKSRGADEARSRLEEMAQERG